MKSDNELKLPEIKHFPMGHEEIELICRALSQHLRDNLRNKDFEMAEKTADLLFFLLHEKQ